MLSKGSPRLGGMIRDAEELLEAVTRSRELSIEPEYPHLLAAEQALKAAFKALVDATVASHSLDDCS